jgi:hypothetical protein
VRATGEGAKSEGPSCMYARPLADACPAAVRFLSLSHNSNFYIRAHTRWVYLAPLQKP